MSRKKPVFHTAEEAEVVFYEAFKHCDADVMAALWARDDVLCIHPGSGALVDYESIVRSWESIFGNAGRTGIRATTIHRTLSDDTAVHVVAEEMLDAGTVVAVVLATNVYRKSDDGWQMVVHHASLVQNHSAGQTLQ